MLSFVRDRREPYLCFLHERAFLPCCRRCKQPQYDDVRETAWVIVAQTHAAQDVQTAWSDARTPKLSHHE